MENLQASTCDENRFVVDADNAQSLEDPSNLEILRGIFNTHHDFPTLESAVSQAVELSVANADASRAAGADPPTILTKKEAEVEMALCLGFADNFLQGSLPNYKGSLFNMMIGIFCCINKMIIAPKHNKILEQ